MPRRERWSASGVITAVLVVAVAGLSILGKLLWFGPDRDPPTWVYPASVLVLVVAATMGVVASLRRNPSGGGNRGGGGDGEVVETVPFEDGNVVIRSGPDARIVFARDVPWKVEVRHRSKDPFGPPIWTGRARDRSDGIELVDRVARQIRSGNPPWT